MERAGVWLTSANTMVAELVSNWATPQGMALVPARRRSADAAGLLRDDGEQHFSRRNRRKFDSR